MQHQSHSILDWLEFIGWLLKGLVTDQPYVVAFIVAMWFLASWLEKRKKRLAEAAAAQAVIDARVYEINHLERKKKLEEEELERMERRRQLHLQLRQRPAPVPVPVARPVNPAGLPRARPVSSPPTSLPGGS